MQVILDLDDSLYKKLQTFNKNIELEIKNILNEYLNKQTGKFDKFVGVLDKKFKTDDVKYNEIIK